MRTSRPILWRKDGEVQIGTGPSAVILGELTENETRLLAELGFGNQPMPAELGRAGVTPERWAHLEELASAHRELPEPLTALPFRPVPLDAHPLTRAVIESLDPVCDGFEELAVLTDRFVSDPERVAPLMRSDRPHLPLVIDDDGVSVGPFVRPGMGPCTRCLELARTEADPAWPTLAPQLLHLPPGRVDRMLVAIAAATAVMALRSEARTQSDGLPKASGEGWRVEHAGVGRFRVPLSPDCGCVDPA
ncbi:MAG TPA: hypothetical protein VFC82_10740 [Actinomycetaceae bacterium]|nr:hypothetical protein [Actinomycetaceae bacterium]